MARAVSILVLMLAWCAGPSGAKAQGGGFNVGVGVGPGVTGGLDHLSDGPVKPGLSVDLLVEHNRERPTHFYGVVQSNVFVSGGVPILSGLTGLGVARQLTPSLDVHAAAGLAAYIDFDWDAGIGVGLSGGFGYELSDTWSLALDGGWNTITTEIVDWTADGTLDYQLVHLGIGLVWHSP